MHVAKKCQKCFAAQKRSQRPASTPAPARNMPIVSLKQERCKRRFSRASTAWVTVVWASIDTASWRGAAFSDLGKIDEVAHAIQLALSERLERAQTVRRKARSRLFPRTGSNARIDAGRHFFARAIFFLS
jgi:hypothetical protein